MSWRGTTFAIPSFSKFAPFIAQNAHLFTISPDQMYSLNQSSPKKRRACPEALTGTSPRSGVSCWSPSSVAQTLCTTNGQFHHSDHLTVHFPVSDIVDLHRTRSPQSQFAGRLAISKTANLGSAFPVQGWSCSTGLWGCSQTELSQNGRIKTAN